MVKRPGFSGLNHRMKRKYSFLSSWFAACVIGLSGCSDDAKKPQESIPSPPPTRPEAKSPPNERMEAPPREPKSQNRQALIGKAWQSLGEQNYEGAIAAAGECIARFEAQAIAAEESLIQENVAIPIGAVTAEQRKAIQRNGPLNDAAVSYYIKGMALASLGKKSEARDAFINAARFGHARIWDPKKGGFWSPAEELPAEIEKLK